MSRKMDDDVIDGKAVTEQERRLAREVATTYIAMCRVRSGKFQWNRVLPLGVKPEDSRFWISFIKTARECIDLDAKPKDFVEAQFDKVAWTRKLPFPAQLHSETCVIAYMEWSAKSLAVDLRARQSASVTMTNDPFEREEAKLERWAERFRTSKRRVLRENRQEFSEAFLHKHGVDP